MAERFVREGNTVVICGRREDALNSAKEKLPSIISRQCDLAKEHERVSLYEWIAKEHGDLNVLVNNAGIQNWMAIDDEIFSNVRRRRSRRTSRHRFISRSCF